MDKLLFFIFIVDIRAVQNSAEISHPLITHVYTIVLEYCTDDDASQRKSLCPNLIAKTGNPTDCFIWINELSMSVDAVDLNRPLHWLVAVCQ